MSSAVHKPDKHIITCMRYKYSPLQYGKKLVLLLLYIYVLWSTELNLMGGPFDTYDLYSSTEPQGSERATKPGN